MKKLFAILAIAGIMASCSNKKKEEKTSATDTTTKTTENKMDADQKTVPTTTTNVEGVPSFSDPEVQKFANDYAAFLSVYKAGLKDPAKFAELSKTMQDWAARSRSVGLKLASNPEEAQKWAQWASVIAQEYANAAASMYKQQ